MSPLIGLLGLTGAGLLAQGFALDKYNQYRGRKLGGVLGDLPEDASTDDKLAAIAGAGLLSPQRYAEIGFGDAQSKRDFFEDTNLTRLQYGLAADQSKRDFLEESGLIESRYNLADRNNARNFDRQRAQQDSERLAGLREKSGAIEQETSNLIGGFNSQIGNYQRALELADMVNDSRLTPGVFTNTEIAAAEMELKNLEEQMFFGYVRDVYGDAEPSAEQLRNLRASFPTFTGEVKDGWLPGDGTIRKAVRNWDAIREQYDRRIAHTQSQIGELLRTSQERIDRLYNPNMGITREPRRHNSGGGITEPDKPDRRTSGMTPAATKAFASLESSYGPLSVTSAHRSPEHNRSVGGARNSQHLHGNAYDIDVSNLTRDERIRLIQAAREAGFAGIGVYDNSLHFDVGPPRAWGSDYTRNTVPNWARPHVR